MTDEEKVIVLRAAIESIRDEAADYDTSYKPDRMKHSIIEMAEAALSVTSK